MASFLISPVSRPVLVLYIIKSDGRNIHPPRKIPWKLQLIISRANKFSPYISTILLLLSPPFRDLFLSFGFDKVGECSSSRINVIFWIDEWNNACFLFFFPSLSLSPLSLFLFVSDETGLFCSTSPSRRKWKLDPDENLAWSLPDCWHHAPRIPVSPVSREIVKFFSHNDVCALILSLSLCFSLDGKSVNEWKL